MVSAPSPFGMVVMGFAFLMIVSTIIQFHRRRITASWAMFWSGLWVIASVMMLFTGTLNRIGDRLFSTDARWMVTYFALIGLFYLAYRLVIMMMEMRRDLTRIVEELAKKK